MSLSYLAAFSNESIALIGIRLERQEADCVIQISERVVFAFEWRPVSRCFTRLDLADRFACVIERGGVEVSFFADAAR